MRLLRLFVFSLCLVAGAPLGSTFLAGAADAVGLSSLSASLDSVGSAEAAFIRRLILRKRPSIGYKTVVVVGDDADDAVETVKVELTPVSGPEPSVSSFTVPFQRQLENGNKRFVFNDLHFPTNAIGTSYTVTTTLLDALGEPLEVKVEDTTVGDDGEARLRSGGVIRKIDRLSNIISTYDFRGVVVGDIEADVARLDVAFTDYSGPAPIPTEFTVEYPARTGGKAVFRAENLTFDDPDAAVDETYTVVVEMKDAAGVSLGSTEMDIVVSQQYPGTCYDGVQNGTETGVDCGGSCLTCPTLDDFSTIDIANHLQDTAWVELSLAASKLGVIIQDNVTYENIQTDAISFIGRIDDGSVIVAGDADTVLFGGSTLSINDGGFVLLNTFTNPDGTVTSTVSVYDEAGQLTDQLQGTEPTCSSPAPVDPLKTPPTTRGPEGLTVFASEAYGDIIIGGMVLDDFND